MKEPIVYAKQETSSAATQRDSRQVLAKAAEGHPIEVLSTEDYITLYHVFERMVAAEPARYGGLTLVRQRVGASRWLAHVAPADPNRVPIEPGPEARTRRAWYAAQLTATDKLVLPTKAEAMRATRAWRHYVPAAKRRRLRSIVRRVRDADRYLVLITRR